jgi:hypothetical protein
MQYLFNFVLPDLLVNIRFEVFTAVTMKFAKGAPLPQRECRKGAPAASSSKIYFHERDTFNVSSSSQKVCPAKVRKSLRSADRGLR